ncbi:MAG: hypothetical protein QXS90_01180 [Candidatus Diapherotrites archaeon]
MEANEKKILIGIGVAAGIGVAGYLLYKKMKKKKESSSNKSSGDNNISSTAFSTTSASGSSNSEKNTTTSSSNATKDKDKSANLTMTSLDVAEKYLMKIEKFLDKRGTIEHGKDFFTSLINRKSLPKTSWKINAPSLSKQPYVYSAFDRENNVRDKSGAPIGTRVARGVPLGSFYEYVPEKKLVGFKNGENVWYMHVDYVGILDYQKLDSDIKKAGGVEKLTSQNKNIDIFIRSIAFTKSLATPLTAFSPLGKYILGNKTIYKVPYITKNAGTIGMNNIKNTMPATLGSVTDSEKVIVVSKKKCLVYEESGDKKEQDIYNVEDKKVIGQYIGEDDEFFYAINPHNQKMYKTLKSNAVVLCEK